MTGGRVRVRSPKNLDLNQIRQNRTAREKAVTMSGFFFTVMHRFAGQALIVSTVIVLQNTHCRAD